MHVLPWNPAIFHGILIVLYVICFMQILISTILLCKFLLCGFQIHLQVGGLVYSICRCSVSQGNLVKFILIIIFHEHLCLCIFIPLWFSCFWQVRKTAQDAVKTILESPPGDVDYHPATTATTKFCVQQIEQLGGMEVRPGHQRLTSPFNLLAVVYMYMQYGDIGRWSLFYCINYFSIYITLTWMITLDKRLTLLSSSHLPCLNKL